MRFLVEFDNGEYPPEWVSEESYLEKPSVTVYLSEAFRFHSFKDANDIIKDIGRGHVVAVDEPTHFRSLNEAAEAVASLRADMLFGTDGQFDHLPRYAQHHLLLALAALETAHQHLKIGWMEQMDRR